MEIMLISLAQVRDAKYEASSMRVLSNIVCGSSYHVVWHWNQVSALALKLAETREKRLKTPLLSFLLRI
jgi:hypothetical protein